MFCLNFGVLFSFSPDMAFNFSKLFLNKAQFVLCFLLLIGNILSFCQRFGVFLSFSPDIALNFGKFFSDKIHFVFNIFLRNRCFLRFFQIFFCNFKLLFVFCQNIVRQRQQHGIECRIIFNVPRTMTTKGRYGF